MARTLNGEGKVVCEELPATLKVGLKEKDVSNLKNGDSDY